MCVVMISPLILQYLTGLKVYPQGSLFQSMVGEPWWVQTLLTFIGLTLATPMATFQFFPKKLAHRWGLKSHHR